MSGVAETETPTYGPYPGSTLDPNYMRSASAHTTQSSLPDQPLPPTPPRTTPSLHSPAPLPHASHSEYLHPPPPTTPPSIPRSYTAPPSLAPSAFSTPSLQSAGAPAGHADSSPPLPLPPAARPSSTPAARPSSTPAARPSSTPAARPSSARAAKKSPSSTSSSKTLLARKTPTFLCANGVCTSVDPGVRKIIVVQPDPGPAPANLLAYVLIAAFVMIFCNPLYGIAALCVALWGMTVVTDYHVAMQMGVVSLWLSILGVFTTLAVILSYLIFYTPNEYYNK